MLAAIVKLPFCESCTPDVAVRHAYVTIRGMQLRAEATSEADGWVEIAPGLSDAPRQIDLIGEASEILVENAAIPSGSYQEVRLEFVARTMKVPSGASKCAGLSNCVVMQDGRVEALRLPGTAAELLISIETTDGHSAAFVAGSNAQLRLQLEPRQMLYRSVVGGATLEYVLSGHATLSQEPPSLAEPPAQSASAIN